MTTKFSQFNNGGAIIPGDLLAGLRNGQDFLFNGVSTPSNPWMTITTSQTLAPNTNYFVANIAPISLTLPVVFPFGQTIKIENVGVSTFTIAQQAGQQIIFGNQFTTVGVGGSLMSNNVGDAITINCFSNASSSFIIESSIGIWTVT
jgi:hypothetical protein